jgi:hypothetical protein
VQESTGAVIECSTVEHCTAYETDDYEYDLKSAVIEENAKIVLKGAKTNNLKILMYQYLSINWSVLWG